MHSDTLKLYHSASSPNSRRVRIFLAEKGLSIPLVAVDLGKGEQHSAAYRAINPRRVVPTAIAGPHDYEQIPELAERSRLRVKHFFADLDARLGEVSFVAGDRFSVADITALVSVDFAAKAINFSVPEKHGSLKRWYDSISSRPSMAA